MLDKPMRLLRRTRIRTRLWGWTMLVILLLATVSVAGIASQLDQRERSDRLLTLALGQGSEGQEVLRHIGRMNRSEKDMIIHYDDAERVRQLQGPWKASVAQVREALARFSASVPARDQALTRQATEALEEYTRNTERVVQQVVSGAYDTGKVADRMMGKSKSHMATLEDSVQALMTSLRQESEAQRAQQARAFRQALWLHAGLLAAVAVILVPFTLLNLQAISRPLDRARQVAHAIAGGDLATAVDQSGRDEVSALMAGLESMRVSLRAMVGELRASTDSIGTASREIASGTLDLSRRTERTAASLQQVSSSMDKLTVGVQHSASASREADTITASAAHLAEEGGGAVDQVVRTMKELEKGSRQIQEIISLIEGITHQTSILSLNAAIEAARAGERGRGFAVVAGEVRLLARRSAEASEQIKSLISASVDRVDVGSSLAARAGERMQALVQSVHRASSVIGEISASSTGQSGEIGQVNRSMRGLDETTQQNAALVQQSSAAAESLKEQVTVLTGLVGRFRL